MRKAWAPDDDAFLKSVWDKMPIEQLVLVIGRSKIAIQTRASKKGIIGSGVKLKHWKPSHDKFLKKNYNIMGITDIAILLDRSENAVRLRAVQLKLTKKARRWTPKETLFLIENYTEMPMKDISEILKKHPEIVSKKAVALGLSKRTKKVHKKSKLRSRTFFNELAKMQVGDEYIYLHRHIQNMRNEIMYFKDRKYVTKRIPGTARRFAKRIK